MTALFLAVSGVGGDAEVAQYFCQHGADLNVKEEYGNEFSTLHSAVSHGNLEGVKKLVENGAHINIKNKSGKTLLDYAKKKKSMILLNFWNKNKLRKMC